MIAIKVNGEPLYVPQGTAVTMEQRQNCMTPDQMGADIVWTFALPAVPNARLLDHQDYLAVADWHRYAAEVWWHGWLLANGSLWVQEAVQDGDLQCGLTLNEVAAGFGDRLLKDNHTYGDPIEIADTLGTHRDGWRKMLLQSLDADSVHKFFLSRSERFYSDNDHYGHHAGEPAPLLGENGWVNRLLHRTDGTGETLCEKQLFNVAAADKYNGYVFAPALRLDWLLRRVMESAGFGVTGTFAADERTANLYLQSLNALDGDATQYDREDWVRLTEGTSQEGTTGGLDFDDHGEQRQVVTGCSRAVFGFHLLLDTDTLTEGTTDGSELQSPAYGSQLFLRWKEAWFLGLSSEDPAARAVMTADRFEHYGNWLRVTTPFPSSLSYITAVENEETPGMAVIATPATGGQFRMEWIDPFAQEWVSENYDPFYYDGVMCDGGLMQLTPDNVDTDINFIGNDGYAAGTFTSRELDPTKQYRFYLLRARVYDSMANSQGLIPSGVNEGGEQKLIRLDDTAYLVKMAWQMESHQPGETTMLQKSLNIFSRWLDYSDHLPAMTNAQLLAAVVQTFGLCVWFGSNERLVQMDYFTDVLQAGALDVTPYVTRREKLWQDPTRYAVQLPPLRQATEVSDRYNLGAFESLAEATAAIEAGRYRKRQFFVNRLKAAYQSAEDDGNWQWQIAGGDGRTLETGPSETMNGDSQTVSPALRVTNLYARADAPTVAMHELAAVGNSEMFDVQHKSDFDAVLVQRSATDATLTLDGQTWTYETATPIAADDPANPHEAGRWTLAVEGENSIGKELLKPWYEFLSGAQPCRLTLSLPTLKAIELMQLLRPQPQDRKQTRWIAVDGQRLFPTAIEYHFTESDRAEATVDCLRCPPGV